MRSDGVGVVVEVLRVVCGFGLEGGAVGGLRGSRGAHVADATGETRLTLKLLEHAVHGAGAPTAAHRDLEIVLVLSHLCDKLSGTVRVEGIKGRV